MLDLKFMQKMSLKTRKAYVDHIFYKGKDAFGRPFKAYSRNKTKWASILARKAERAKIPKEGISYGDAKKMGILQRQRAEFANTTSPVLTGDLLRDTKSFATATSFGIRFAKDGHKVKYLNEMKRELSAENQPFPKKILKTIEQDVGKEISKQFKNKTTKITLGK